jgi:catechol 2,3-dioxygenase-like lactoylglutathione lyase family enzyme
MSMSVGLLDHYNLRTRKFDETVRFYRDVLGLTKGPRPDFPEPGAWMYSEGRPVVHLVDLTPGSEPQKADSGVVHHVAFVSRGFDAMKKHLSSTGVEFRTVSVPGNKLWQIFIGDPNGVVVELNYDAERESIS